MVTGREKRPEKEIREGARAPSLIESANYGVTMGNGTPFTQADMPTSLRARTRK